MAKIRSAAEVAIQIEKRFGSGAWYPAELEPILLEWAEETLDHAERVDLTTLRRDLGLEE